MSSCISRVLTFWHLFRSLLHMFLLIPEQVLVMLIAIHLCIIQYTTVALSCFLRVFCVEHLSLKWHIMVRRRSRTYVDSPLFMDVIFHGNSILIGLTMWKLSFFMCFYLILFWLCFSYLYNKLLCRTLEAFWWIFFTSLGE